MSKEQKRLAAIILCIMGIVGSLMAMKDRSIQTAEVSQEEKSQDKRMNEQFVNKSLL